MWVFFGFITLTSFTIYFWYKRLHASWKGVSGSTGDIIYQFKATTDKEGKVVKLLIGIDAPDSYDYTLKRENALDRFVKAIGISTEHQTGNIRFDDLVYIVSDNARFHKQLTADSTIVDAFMKIFLLGKTFQCVIQEVQHNSGRLWLTIEPVKGLNERKVPQLASRMVPLLDTIAKELVTIPLSATNSWKDPFTTKAAILLAISSALAVNGGLQLFRFVNMSNTITLDRDALLTDALSLGLLISGTLALIAIYTLGRSSRTHLVLIELLFLGSIGSVVTVYAELNDINVTADTSKGVKYESVVYDKRSVSQRRGATKYYLTMRDWNAPDITKKIKVRVPGSLYYEVARQDRLIVMQKAGYFHYRWIESIKKP